MIVEGFWVFTLFLEYEERGKIYFIFRAKGDRFVSIGMIFGGYG